MGKLGRSNEVKFLKKEIKNFIKRLKEINPKNSISLFHKEMPRVGGSGYNIVLYEDGRKGHKPSLRQQYEYLKQLTEVIEQNEINRKKLAVELENKIEAEKNKPTVQIIK